MVNVGKVTLWGLYQHLKNRTKGAIMEKKVKAIVRRNQMLENEIQKNPVNEIIQLHNEIGQYLKMSLDKAIRIGELLTEQKASLKHGEWLPWIDANLPFSRQTADNYRRCYEDKDKLLSVGNLTDAYKLLSAPNKGDQVKRLQAELNNVNSISDETARLKEYLRIRDEAARLENEAAEDRIRAEREAGKLLNEIEKADYLVELLKTEWAEIMPTGLKIKRPSTQDEWLEYGKRLKRVDTLLDEWLE
jgi:hypothetical protein